MWQEVAFFSQWAKAKSERKPDGLVTEGVDMIGEKEGRNPELISVMPGPFLKNAAPNSNCERARNDNVFGRVWDRREVWGDAMTARTGVSGRGRGPGARAYGEPPYMELVYALSGSVWKSSGVRVGEDGGDRQMFSSRITSAN